MQDSSEVKYNDDLGEMDLRFLSRSRWDWVIEAQVADLLGASYAHDRREAVEVAREQLQANLEGRDFWTITPDSVTAELRFTMLLYAEGKYSEEQVRSVWRNITQSPNAPVAAYSRCRGYWRWIAEMTDEVVHYGGTAIEADG